MMAHSIPPEAFYRMSRGAFPGLALGPQHLAAYAGKMAAAHHPPPGPNMRMAHRRPPHHNNNNQQQQRSRANNKPPFSRSFLDDVLDPDMIPEYSPSPKPQQREMDFPVRLFTDRVAGVTYSKGKKDPKRIDEGRLVVREFLAKRSECPFSDILSILCRSENGTTLHDSINADVVGMLLDELDAWATKAGENGSGIPFLVKKRAFNVFSSNRGSAFAVKVARAFRMVPDRMRFRRCISRLVSRRGYAKALRWIRALNLPLTYSVTKILLNLLVRGQLSEIRSYFDVSPVERAPFLKIVDKILGLRYQERLQFLEDNKVRGLKFWSLTERNLTRAIIRLLPKNENEAADVLKECANMNRCKSARLFKDVITKTFVHESMTENKYASLVRGIIGNNVELAEMFVHCLFDRDLWREAQVWMEIFGIDSPELVKQLRRYQAMEGLFAGAGQQLSYLVDSGIIPGMPMFGEETTAHSQSSLGVAAPLEENAFEVPLDAIKLLATSDDCVAAFDEILESVTVVGLDAEWRPVLKKGLRPAPAMFQIATLDRVYVIDVVALGGVLSDEAASKLKDVLTSSEIRKIGFAMSNDLALLADLHPSLSDMPTAIQSMWDFKAFRDRGFDLLKSMYPDVEMEGPNKLGGSLNALVHLVLGKYLVKPPNVRSSDWSKRPLTDEQIQYAAMDASCLLKVYEALKKKAEECEVELEVSLDAIPRGRTRSISQLRSPSRDPEPEHEHEQDQEPDNDDEEPES